MPDAGVDQSDDGPAWVVSPSGLCRTVRASSRAVRDLVCVGHCAHFGGARFASAPRPDTPRALGVVFTPPGLVGVTLPRSLSLSLCLRLFLARSSYLSCALPPLVALPFLHPSVPPFAAPLPRARSLSLPLAPLAIANARVRTSHAYTPACSSLLVRRRSLPDLPHLSLPVAPLAHRHSLRYRRRAVLVARARARPRDTREESETTARVSLAGIRGRGWRENGALFPKRNPSA